MLLRKIGIISVINFHEQITIVLNEGLMGFKMR